jgi:hypothetical protein
MVVSTGSTVAKLWGGGIYGQEGVLVTLPLFFRNKKSRLKIEMGGEADRHSYIQTAG